MRQLRFPRAKRQGWTRAPIALLSLLMLLAACGGGGGGSSPTQPTPAPSPQTIIVMVQDDSFSPKQVTINPGDTVRWVRSGSHPGHTVTALDGSFDSGSTFQTATVFEKRFDTADKTYEYQCQTHYACCQMQGSVRVGAQAPTPRPGY